MTSKVLRTLGQKQLIRRTEHQTDTRAKAIELTEGGKQLLQQVIAVVERVDNEFFADVSQQTMKLNAALNLLMQKNIL